MPSPFSLGAKNSDKAFSRFVDGDVTFFTVALTTIQTQVEVAHGLSAAPDFALLSSNAIALAASTGHQGYSATATTITVIDDNTAAATTVSVLCGNIS
jgi:hypothetical protein